MINRKLDQEDEPRWRRPQIIFNFISTKQLWKKFLDENVFEFIYSGSFYLVEINNNYNLRYLGLAEFMQLIIPYLHH